MPITGTVPLTGKIAPTSELDTYPVTDPQFGLGGLRSVGTTAQRDAIAQERREEGMMVYVQDADSYYALVGGTSNSDWVLFTPSGLGPQGPTGSTGADGTTLLLIDTFTTTIDDIVMKGNTAHSLAGESISVTYAGGVVPATGAIYLTDPTQGTGFPVYFPTSAMDSITFSAQTITAGIGDTVTLRLVVTGSASVGDTHEFTVAIGNEVRWGKSTLSSLNGEEIQSILTNALLTSEVSASLPHTVNISTQYDEYMYYAFPTRFGSIKQSINNSPYGGMYLQGQLDIPGDASVTSSNTLGFTESFYVTRSRNPNLGTSVELRTVAT
jgi:hypothetical protein